MYDGGLPIQDRDIDSIPSLRRNPVIADVFAQLDYMEKRGSGLKKMQDLETTLPSFKGEPTPTFHSNPHAFFTTFRNMNYGLSDDDFLKIVGDNGDDFMNGGSPESTQETSIGSQEKFPRKINASSQRILDLVITDPTMTIRDMATSIGISERAVKKNLSILQSLGLLTRVGATKKGFWKVFPNNPE